MPAIMKINRKHTFIVVLLEMGKNFPALSVNSISAVAII